MNNPMDDLRQASADVSGVELEPCWWQKAARKKVEEKTEAIFDAYCTLADLRNHEVTDREMLAVALREVINQCQDSQGMIAAPELFQIARELDEPRRIVLPPEDFDALKQRLAEPGQYDPRVARVLSTPAPWDDDCDKTSTSTDE